MKRESLTGVEGIIGSTDPAGTVCQFPKKKHGGCRIPAQLVWYGLEVCHVHHPDATNAVNKGDAFRAWLVKKLWPLLDDHARAELTRS